MCAVVETEIKKICWGWRSGLSDREECLPNKHEALNSNPITTKTKERKKKYKVLEN
jgi:hypothetical protein